MPAADRDIVLSLLGERPELQVLAEGVAIAPGSTFDTPFRVPTGDSIEISPAVLRSGAALPVHLRHALEIAMWHRIAPAPRSAATELATAALGCWTALQYLSTLTVPQGAAVLAALPPWMRQLQRFTQERDAEGDAAGTAAELVTVGACLLHLQRTTIAGVTADRDTLAQAAAVVADLLDIARPVERLLTSGGDTRVCLDAVTRANKYGCGAVPAPPADLAFSSCTASSPSALGYRAAEEERRRLLRARMAGVPLRIAFGASIEEARGGLAAALGTAAAGADVLLSASGTDCALHALQLALSGHDDDLVSIVVGPDEIGSGSLAAAGGRHFDQQTPLGGATTPGQPLEGLPVDRVHVETVAIRDGCGRPIAVEQLDAAVASLARRAVRRGARVLLHVVEGSKTGLRVPGIDAVKRLQQEMGDSLMVLVDAAQMRTRPETLLRYLRSGWLVMISGSKFFMGPPFSGALLVPRPIARRAVGGTALPAGLGMYLSAFEVPPSWTGWRAALRLSPNLGLLLRWRAALAEIEAFHGTGRDVQRLRLAALAARVGTELSRRPWLQVVPSADDDGDAPDLPQTLWTFVLMRDAEPGQASAAFDYDEAWRAFVLLNRDVSAMLPAHATPAERQVAAIRCHIGQPVRLRWSDGAVAGGLRIALGARSVAAHPDGPARVLDKLEVIQRYWRQLTARQAVA